MVRMPHSSGLPRLLDPTESLLFDSYIQRFSRTYPTHSGPSNPFLSVLVPLASQNDVVLNSLLALSGAQGWDRTSPEMESVTLRLKHRALQGCRALLQEGPFAAHTTNAVSGHELQMSASSQRSSISSIPNALSEENVIFLLASSVLFLLYEKISGEENWKPHIEFINRLFNQHLHRFTSTEAYQFLHSIFLYNDLVRSTSLQLPTLSSFYLRAAQPQVGDAGDRTGTQSRHYFPRLIARISTGEETVSDEDIAVWDGILDWLPSFALTEADNESTIASPRMHHVAANHFSATEDAQIHEGRHSENVPGPGTSDWNDQRTVSELYRTAARIFRRQILRKRQHTTVASESGADAYGGDEIPYLASWAIQLIQSLPEGSVFDNALLLPIGVAGRELTAIHSQEREYIILRLRSLEQRFQMRHFRRVQEVLINHWSRLDGTVLMPSNQDDTSREMILFG
ncbi:hypothetical protein NA57DRAFT_77838 [Rhizodiscina lignyota]|uniref:Uncharacterized protein n=1 Tax=Rhizodiscina lignyota TaxID=1504668 RepID=A0A9P4M4D2_9PEZI|nr:hypothetical protein NA57DRAFT_77838 [Rhizodiscina lignyota]